MEEVRFLEVDLLMLGWLEALKWVVEALEVEEVQDLLGHASVTSVERTTFQDWVVVVVQTEG